MTAVVSDERLAEVIDFHERLRCMQAERNQLKEACMADDVVQALTHYRTLRHQQRAAEQWRPIETCPLDTWVLLWWVPNTENPTNIRYNSCAIKAQVSSYEPGCYWRGDGDIGVLGCKPGYGPLRLVTHWIPLPDVPHAHP